MSENQVKMWRSNILTHLSPNVKNIKDINVKNSRDSVRCKYQLKKITKTKEKKVATNENCILRKMSLKLWNPSFTTLCKIALWNSSKSGWIKSWLYGLPRNKGQPVWLFGGTVLRNDKVHLQDTTRIFFFYFSKTDSMFSK